MVAVILVFLVSYLKTSLRAYCSMGAALLIMLGSIPALRSFEVGFLPHVAVVDVDEFLNKNVSWAFT
jgi:hypothetical protein